MIPVDHDDDRTLTELEFVEVAVDAQVQIDTLKHRILAFAMIAAADTQRATADAYLNTQLDALSRETPPNASA